MGIIAMTEGTKECGAIVWWSLSGQVSDAEFRRAWEEAGMNPDHAPVPVTPAMAMRRACQELAETRRLIRPLKARGQYAVVLEHAVDKEISHETHCRIYLNEQGSPVVEPHDQALASAVGDAYDTMLSSLLPDDFSYWLIQQARAVCAVNLRERGGVYFIPREQMPVWRKLVAVVREHTNHTIYEVPAMTTEDAVEAILDAVTREAEQAAKDFEADLELTLGARALNSRVDRCREIQRKIKTYEAVLGKGLEQFTEQLVTLEGQLAAAALAASSLKTEAA